MREADRTPRERIAAHLREDAATPSELADELDLTPHAIIRHIRHVARSVDGNGEQFLVRPPACRQCGFDGYDDPLNLPSRCPDCKHEGIEEPAFVVES